LILNEPPLFAHALPEESGLSMAHEENPRIIRLTPQFRLGRRDLDLQHLAPGRACQAFLILT
jgi:hypothetical protein